MTVSRNSARLSVAMIVRDASAAVHRTLESLHGVDEIVIADTGSVDDTVELIQRSEAKLVTLEWEDSFSAARNQAWEHVTGDWVLWLDAGETLSHDDLAALREFVRTEANQDMAYVQVIVVPAEYPTGSTEQIGRLRLMPNRPDLRFSGRVRENIFSDLSKCGMQMGGLPYRIRRGPDEHPVELKRARARRNIELAEREINETQPRADLLNCLADALQTLEDYKRAADCCRHALQRAEKGSSEMLEAYYGLLTSLDQVSGQRDEQLRLAVEANEVFPQDAQLLCAMGGYLQSTQQTQLAEKAYESAFRYGQINPAVWHVADVREIAAVCLALSLQLRGESRMSRQVLEEALSRNADSQRLRRHTIELLIKIGDQEAALAQVDRLPQDTPHLAALRAVIRGGSLAVQKNWIPARAHLKASYNAGYRDPLCLRWYATVLISCGDLKDAQPIVSEWRKLEPQNAEAARYGEWLKSELPDPTDGTRQWRIDETGHQQSGPTASNENVTQSDDA